MDVLDDQRSEISKKITRIANPQDRFRHLVVDGLIIFFIHSVIRQFLFIILWDMDYMRESLPTICHLLVTYLIYYLFCEGIFNRTFGHLVNKTMIITPEEERPNFKAVFIRTLTRLIPLGFITILSPRKQTLHDILSNTWMVRIK